jgi:hypothetical protein
MKKIFFIVMGAATLIVSSCSKDKFTDLEKPLILGGANPDTLVGHITGIVNVTKTTYLKGIVFVDSLATLNVSPGVTIKGSPGTGVPNLIDLSANKGTLIVRRGGKLIANGTPTSPIVWTSSFNSPNRNFGDWGGIVIQGKAPIKTTSGATENVYEAFSTANDKIPFLYGGTLAGDNSGSIKYNRIEFAGGVVLTANQEVNGLTFAGVGAGTVVDFVEVSNSGDDAFEFFGGTVNAKHLLSWNNKDDDYDFDESYQGFLQFIIAYRGNIADNSGSEFIETDNNSGPSVVFPGVPRTHATVANATFICLDTAVRADLRLLGSRFDGGVYIRRQSSLNLANSLIIAGKMPVAIGVTPSTRDSIDNIVNLPFSSERIFIRYNIWQTEVANAVVWDNDEGNKIDDGTATLLGAPDNALIGVLGDGTQVNTALPNFAAFKLNPFLIPQPGSPALSGGLSLNYISPFFVNTTQRGAVITTDPWTSSGTWISTSVN